MPTKDNVDESSEGGEGFLYEEYKGYEEIVEHIIEDVEVQNEKVKRMDDKNRHLKSFSQGF